MTAKTQGSWDLLMSKMLKSDTPTASTRIAMVAKQVYENNLLQGGPNWVNANHPWMRYVRAEAYELMEHYGTFKHWKAHTTDMAQAQMEMVDILIFALSDSIANRDIGLTCKSAGAALERERSADHHGEFNTLIEDLVSTSFRNAFDWATFARMCSKLGMDYDRLIDLFEGKNALNYIRATNGYKEGTYVKMWFGHEDNQVLRESVLDSTTVMTQVRRSGPQNIQANLRIFLQDLYDKARAYEEEKANSVPASAANAH